MSSKNPFRQSFQADFPVHDDTASSTFYEARGEQSRDDAFATLPDRLLAIAPEQRRRSKPKRVRIQTPPPLSPDSTRNSVIVDGSVPQNQFLEPEGRFLGSLPMELTLDSSSTESYEDPFTRESERPPVVSQDDQSLPGTALGSNVVSGDVAVLPHVANPFRRTLATIEPGSPGTAPLDSTEIARRSAAQRSDDSVRKPMDVDTFQRLLLTGTADLPPSSTLSPQLSSSAPPHADCEPTRPQKPSSAQELTLHQKWASENTTSRLSDIGVGSRFNVVQASLEATSKEARKTPPPPPKPRHGKPISNQVHKAASAGRVFSPESVAFSPSASTDGAALPRLNSGELRSDSASAQQQPQPQPQPQQTQPDWSSESTLKSSVPLLTRQISQQAVSQSTISMAFPTNSTKSSQNHPRAPQPPPARRSTASTFALSNASSRARKSSNASTNSIGESISLPLGRQRSSSRSSSIASSRTSAPPLPPSRRRASSRGSIDLSFQATPQSDERQNVDAGTDTTTTANANEESSSRNAFNEDFSAGLDALQAEIDGLQSKSA